jgi:RNA 2',3'-cyclic 3'-phosphodiesterase
MIARLFVAMWPPASVIEALTALHSKDERGVRFVTPEQWHVTLRFLGQADPLEVADALDRTTLPVAHGHLGPAVDLLGERALIVPVAGVDALAAVVIRATRRIGEPPGKRFVGHVTVARLKRHAHAPRALGALVDADFDVDEIALVQSRLHPDGARYETLRTWPVAGEEIAPAPGNG